nr:hypothetical protein [Micromonospora sp. KC207]
MAQRLGVDHQGLQPFVTTSTWDTDAVRMRLQAGRARAVSAAAGRRRRLRRQQPVP